MEFNKPIADMLPGMDVEGFYILRAAALKTTNNGKPFLSGTICDRTGSVEIKIWDYSGPIGARPDDTGRVVKIRGRRCSFWRCLLLTLALSVGIEVVQPLLHVFRRADITDVITNTIGGVLGYALWALGNVSCKKRQG